MLLVVIGHRRKKGVSKARVGEILGLEVSSYLDDLLRQGLIYYAKRLSGGLALIFGFLFGTAARAWKS